MLFCCGGCQQTQLWASTGVFGDHYLINHKLAISDLVIKEVNRLQMGQAFTAEMGVVRKWYLDKN